MELLRLIELLRPMELRSIELRPEENELPADLELRSICGRLA
jgi:hypothetical protein